MLPHSDSWCQEAENWWEDGDTIKSPLNSETMHENTAAGSE